MRKYYVVLGLCLLALACKPTGYQPPQDTLVIGILADLDTPMEYISNSAFTTELSRWLFLPLAEEQPDFQDHPPTFKPMLAESWRFSSDHLTLTVHLRKGVKWSDGTPVTSQDVLFTHQIATNPTLNWTGRSVKAFITHVQAPTDDQVVYTFSKKYPYQFMDVNEGVILPAHRYASLPTEKWRSTDFTQNLVVDGPYTLGEWKRQEFFRLDKNPDYYDPSLPRIPHLYFQVIPDQNTLLQQLKSGYIDMMEVVPPKDAAELEKNPDITVVRFPDRQYGYIGWNLKHPLFQDKIVRRALTHAINRQAIVDTVWYGFAKVACSPIHSSLWAYNKNLKPLPYDPQKAKSLLAQAGWKDQDGDGVLDKEGKPFAFTLMTNTGNKIREEIGVMVQAQLRDVGIKVNFQTVEWNVFLKKLTSKDFESFIQAWRVGTKVDLYDIWHTDAMNPQVGLNVISYSNKRVDALIEKARILPAEEAKPLWDEAQQLIQEDQPYTFLYENERINAIRKRVKGYEMNSLSSYFHLPQWYIEP